MSDIDAIEAVRNSLASIYVPERGNVESLLAAYDAQATELRALRERLNATCVWTCDSNGTYQTGCGRGWEFTDGDIAQNGMRFCHNCGKRVEPFEAEHD